MITRTKYRRKENCTSALSFPQLVECERIGRSFLLSKFKLRISPVFGFKVIRL
nr:MAG TPA: hypothetical protein [Bacteriophage sp.]